MSFLGKLFDKKNTKAFWHLTLNLNARLMPIDRGDIFEDPIDNALKKSGIGEVDGGGTLLSETGEIENCDVEICLYEKSDVNYEKLQSLLAHMGIPKGSFLICENEETKQEIGDFEGLALYLNGTDLDSEVYESCDINFVISELVRILDGEHKYYSYWEGSKETALYFYGQSFEKMRELLSSFVEEYPLCQKCRIVQIA